LEWVIDANGTVPLAPFSPARIGLIAGTLNRLESSI
jgi:hypothetical protein